MTREELGRIVREVWVSYCIETNRTDRPDRICPWEEMDKWSQEVDMRIGEVVQDAVLQVHWQQRWPWYPGYWWIFDGHYVYMELKGRSQIERMSLYKMPPRDWYAEVALPKPPAEIAAR